MTAELERLPFTSARAWRVWLEANHDTAPGIWLMIAKKGSGVESVTYDEAVDESLCFGWIDGQKAKHDDQYFLQRFTRRTKRSPWSRVNTERVARLVNAKRMHPAGLREVEAAKADGRWEVAYAGQASAVVPEDLQDALDASPAAAGFFAELDSANRYAILYRIGAVKRAETRAKKIARFVADLERGKTPASPQTEVGGEERSRRLTDVPRGAAMPAVGDGRRPSRGARSGTRRWTRAARADRRIGRARSAVWFVPRWC
jgi:uncharacterized protein YdeI (YjbR/CyaY-like superfamily)